MEYGEKFKSDCKLLGKRIQYFRELKNMTLKELSSKSKIRLSYLKKIENGEALGVKVCSHLFMISNALEINFYELFIFKE